MFRAGPSNTAIDSRGVSYPVGCETHKGGATMEERVRIEIQSGVADVRMMRADKMNALDEEMFEGLVAAGERLKNEPGVRAVVLSGEGRAFCAGLDMGNFGKMAQGRSSNGAASQSGL